MSGPEVRALGVLIVDDSVTVRNALRALLSAMPGVKSVREAGSVAEAVAALDEERPDLVLLDLHIQGGTGLDVLRVLRGRTYVKRPVVIVLTMLPGTPARERSLAAGADLFVDKATEIHLLPQLVEALCREVFSRD